MNKPLLDFKSIHFKLLVYFAAFALLIIALIGGMEILLFNNFYGTMKERDTVTLANTIKNDYLHKANAEGFDLDEFVEGYAAANDVYILVMKRNGDSLYRETGSSGATGTYTVVNAYTNPALWQIYMELAASNYENRDSSQRLRRRAARMTTDDMAGGRNVLAYACYLEREVDTGGEIYDGVYGTNDEDDEEGYGDASIGSYSEPFVMFVLAPLYPTTSTIRILLNIMTVIIAFAAVLVLVLALYLSQRISKPIKDITRSAEKLGEGDYSVKFDGGGHYSEITELADTLTEAEHEMQKTEMYQKDLIANVSHDIRTPLTMIKSYAEMINDISGDDPEKRKEHLGIIIEETDRLNVLVNDMLNLSRLQSHKLELEKSLFDLNETTSDVLSTYDILQEQEGYHIIRKDFGPCMVEADESKISQVMNNLLTNAVKYCGEDKEIIVELKRVKKNVVFSVTDHGQGIAADELPHVWDKYYKSSTHHVRETSGTGLGLSIVREILKMHDAEYGVESEVGKGSTFWFSLPIAK